MISHMLFLFFFVLKMYNNTFGTILRNDNVKTISYKLMKVYAILIFLEKYKFQEFMMNAVIDL